MSQVGILTESSTLTLNDDFPGREVIHFVHPEIWFEGVRIPERTALQQLPKFAPSGSLPELRYPSSDRFESVISSLMADHEELIVLLPAQRFSFAWKSLHQAVERSHYRSRIHWIDTQTFAGGAGLLSQAAAQAAAAGASHQEILALVRKCIPNIYTILCVCSLAYLHRLGVVDNGQMLAGDILQMKPVWLLESGQLIPIQKARSNKNFVDLFYDFLHEIGDIHTIGLIRGSGCFDKGADLLAERVKREHPRIDYAEKSLPLSAAAVIGPASVSLVVLESIPRSLI